MRNLMRCLALCWVIGIAGVASAEESPRVQEVLNAVGDLTIEEHKALVTAVSRSLRDRMMAVSPEIRERWKAFAEVKGQGLAKLINRGVLGDMEGMRGGGAYFSFLTQSNSYDRSPQLELQDFAFGSGFYGGSDGIVMRLTSAEISDVTLEDCNDDLTNDYPDAVEKLWQIKGRAAAPVAQMRNLPRLFTMTNPLSAEVDKVYAVRWASYNEGDTLAAFQVVERDENSVTIAWRVLKQFPIPRRKR